MEHFCIDDFIDNRNEEIWNLLFKHYNIRITNSLNNEYSCYTQNSQAIIYIVPTDISIQSFTHELLHLYLKYKEFYLGNSIKLLIRDDILLSRIFSDALIEHIGNCLDHIKMFKIYTDLGFEKSKFILDYNLPKCNDEELNYIKKNFKHSEKINLNIVDLFIGKLIGILCDPK